MFLESSQLWLYQLEQWSTLVVNAQLEHLSWLSFGVIGLAGLLTSLSPCMLSMLPITVGYVGGYSSDSQSRSPAWIQSGLFALGVAITLASLGLGSAWLGRVYGQQAGGIWPIVMGVVAVVMGLNLLQVLPIRFPDLASRMPISPHWPQGIRSLVLGLTFGLVASPCSTPVLVALLSWVATAHNPLVGAGVLLAYAVGLVAPLVVAGIFTSTLKQLLAMRQWSSWVTTGAGILLVGFGSLTVFSHFSQI